MQKNKNWWLKNINGNDANDAIAHYIDGSHRNTSQ